MLAGEGCRNVVSITGPRRTLDLVSVFDPDLVLLDLIETMLRICNLLETSLLYKRLQALTAPEPPLRWNPGRTPEARWGLD